MNQFGLPPLIVVCLPPAALVDFGLRFDPDDSREETADFLSSGTLRARVWEGRVTFCA